MIQYILNGKLVDSTKAFIHVHDLAILRGYGVFDFFKLEGATPLFIDEHLDRFYSSANQLRLSCPLNKKELKEKIMEMLKANKIKNSGVRIVLTGGESTNGYEIGNPNLIVLNEPIKLSPEEFREEGISLSILEYQRDIPEAKTINYIMGIHNLPSIKKAGTQDTLYIYQGQIYELTRSNFFIIDSENKIITAKDGVLKGINRNKLLEACSKDFIIEERPVKVKELETAKEAFITGTNKRVIPVVKVGDTQIGNGKPGKQSTKVQECYDAFVRQYIGQNQALF